MGRKSSAKQSRPPGSASSEPPSQPPRPSLSLLAGVIFMAVAIVGAFVYSRNRLAVATGGAASGDPAAQAVPADVPAVDQKPHPQANLPPLPFSPVPPARPTDVVIAAYKFAAEHPEILSYVPCYCGCENAGHRGNEDCFVARRDANGDVTDWEPHGMT